VIRLSDERSHEIEAKNKWPKGKRTLRFHFDNDGGGINQAELDFRLFLRYRG
jgi:hypothetical protein